MRLNLDTILQKAHECKVQGLTKVQVGADVGAHTVAYVREGTHKPDFQTVPVAPATGNFHCIYLHKQQNRGREQQYPVATNSWALARQYVASAHAYAWCICPCHVLLICTPLLLFLHTMAVWQSRLKCIWKEPNCHFVIKLFNSNILSVSICTTIFSLLCSCVTECLCAGTDLFIDSCNSTAQKDRATGGKGLKGDWGRRISTRIRGSRG